MVEGIVKTPEDSGHSIRFEGARPSLKGKLKGYPPDFKAWVLKQWKTWTLSWQFSIMRFTKCRVAHCIYDLTALLLPRVLRRLIEECWHPQAMGRPTFSEIIIRLDKIYAHCAKQGSWKESLKIWFVFRRSKRIKYRSVRSRIHTELWTLMFSKKKGSFIRWTSIHF